MHLTTKSRRQLGRPLKVGLLTAGILLALSGAVIVYQPSEPVKAPEPQWLPVEPKPMILRLGLVGRLEPASLVTFTAPFDGTVQEKLVEEGLRVKRGQALLRLDTAQLEIQLREALSSLLKAKRAVHDLEHWPQGLEVARVRRTVASVQMNLNDTELKLAETSTLLARGIVPRMEVDALEQQAKAQRIDLAAAQAELQEVLSKGNGENRQIAEMELANATAKYDALRTLQARRELTAPFAGIVMRVPGAASDKPTEPVQRGARTSQGQPLFGLANLEQLRVVAKVEEVDINQIQEGQPVEITGDGFDGIALSGNVASVGSQVVTSDLPGSAGVSYEVMVTMPPLTAEQQKHLKLGMSAKLSIVIYQNDSAIVIPPEAIRKEGQQLFVEYSDAEDKEAQRVTVKAGRVTTEGVEVFGLKPGYVQKTLRP
ncbi:efflux RND transporter periplasmic adaptor subunit [Methylobacter sp. Wu8]|uniref:efflux RND transporter periplasmic adaptor subunit n=1 Tax=Methylobacter sp. Wu8 TaxID=3118457 RepID=UPI002F2C0F76